MNGSWKSEMLSLRMWMLSSLFHFAFPQNTCSPNLKASVFRQRYFVSLCSPHSPPPENSSELSSCLCSELGGAIEDAVSLFRSYT